MRAKRIIFAVLAISGSLSAMAQGAADIANGLLQTTSYLNDATFEVLLPQAMDPVVYDVTLQSVAVTDSLSPSDYLIRWSTTTNSGPIEGFSAYFDGNHYRYRNNRLQEYHVSANPAPFLPLGPGSEKSGVQATAQFVDLLPQQIGARLLEIISDSSYIYQYHPDTLVNGKKAIVFDGVKRGSGYDQQVFTYVLDPVTLLPRYTELESSPGSISEQIVTINYASHSEQPEIELSEEGLIEQWPEIFEKYRESTFRAENLVNTPLPAFACQELGGDERYTHHRDENFSAPVILCVLDPSVSTTPSTIAAIREAVDSAPMDIEVIYAFNSNNASEISQAVGELRHGEKALTSANSLIRNCGITLFPTTILADRTSKVHDVIAGYNNDLTLVVLQKAILLK